MEHDPLFRGASEEARHPRSPMTTGRRLLVGVAIASLWIAAVIWGGIGYHLHERQRSAYDRAERDAANLAVTVEGQVERTIAGLDQALRFSQAEYEEAPARFDLRTFSTRLSAMAGVSQRISMINARGDIVATHEGPVEPEAAVNIADREHFKLLAERADAGLVISRPLIGRSTGRWSVQLARRLSAPDGSFEGIIAIALDPDYLSRLFAALDVGADGVVSLIGKDGYIRARSPLLPGIYEGAPAMRTRVQPGCAPASPGGPTICRFRGTLDGIERMYASRPVPGLPLVLSVGRSVEAIEAQLSAERHRIVALGALVTLVLAGAVALLLRELRHRARREAALRDSEARFRDMAEVASDWFWEMDRDLRFTYFSDRLTAITGRLPADAVGKTRRDLGAPEGPDQGWDAHLADLDAHRPFRNFTYRHVDPDGRARYTRTSGVPVFGADGLFRGYRGVAADVTEAVEAETRLQLSEARHRLLADHATDMIVKADLDTTRRYVSPACRELLGYEPEELIGTRPLDAVHPDDAEAYARALEELTAGRSETASSVQRYRRKDGSWVWVEATFRLVRDGASGRPTGYVASVRDISVRKAAEEAVAVSEARYRLLADNSSDLIVLGHDDGRRSYISPAVTRMLGYTVEEAHRVPMAEWIHPEDIARVFQETRSLTGDSPRGSVMYRLKRKEGAYIWSEAAFQRVVDTITGEVTIITAIRDVSERQAQAEALRAAKDAAEAASEAKTEFLASMSHEIRTPLNGVLGYTELLLDDPALNDSQRRHLERIQTAGAALLTVVNDILDFSKIEAGQVELDPQPFPLTALVDNTVSITRGEAERKGLTFMVEIGPGLPATVVGDQDRLRQVLLNLIHNAVKFTQAGSVTLRLAREGEDEGRVRFEVADTGIGIPKDKLHRLFQRFSQVDGSVRRRFGGTGLGLAISQRLVALMGGTIGVESEHLEGTTFRFSAVLPQAEGDGAAAAGPHEAEQPAARPARLLLVEDLAINQELARAVLTAAGHEVDAVGDGADAIMAVQAKPYDLVLMDVQMPGMDGITATGHIRALEHAAARVPIIAMTANVLPAQVAAFRKAGMDDHVGKPFKREELLGTIRRWLAAEPAGEAPTPSRPELPSLDAAAYAELLDMLGREKMQEMLASLSELLAAFPPDAASAGELAREAHRLVSAAGMLGFREMSGLCGTLEAACGRGGDLAALLGEVRAARGRALDAIRTLREAA